MLRSMTGFGKGEAENSTGRVYIEIKSLNHKYFDMISRLPTGFLMFEDKIKSTVYKAMHRGRVNLSLDYEDFNKKKPNAYIDITAAQKYVKQLKALKRSLGISGEVTVEQILSMPGIIAHSSQKSETKHLWPTIKKALSSAIKHLILSKAEEGRATKAHLLKLSKTIEGSLKNIKRYTKELEKNYKSKLSKSIRRITGTKRISRREKLEEEVAIFIRNSDISEEINRIGSHIKTFKKAAQNHKEIGRRLDFIGQEISREANTVGAKAGDYRIAKEVIKIKSAVEKIREQAQNVE